MDLILAALLIALAVTGVRALRRRLKRRSANAPGCTPDAPLRPRNFHELDAMAVAARCSCGGVLRKLGETTRYELRVVKCTCTECEEDVDLFFVLPPMLH